MNDGKATYIYVLRDPTGSSTSIYIGASVNPKLRFKTHLTPSLLRANNHKNNWIKSLLEKGVKPYLSYIDIVEPDCDWQRVEINYIAYFRTLHGTSQILNATDGGHGTRGRIYLPPSQETIAKMRAAHLGQTVSPEQKIAISRALKGRVISADIVERVAAKHRGMKRSAEARARIAEGQRGKIRTLESRLKQSAALTGRVGKSLSTETRSKLSAIALRRPPMSEETKAKISAIIKSIKRKEAIGVRGDVLATWRIALNLSREAAARLLKISSHTIKSLEEKCKNDFC